MSIEDRVAKLEREMRALQESFLQSQKNLVPITGKVDDTSNKVVALTPYTDTQTAYYGETEKTFYGVPDGVVSVYFDAYDGAYSTSRIEDRLTVTFDALTEQTNITISIQ